jgi:hypothetical protein
MSERTRDFLRPEFRDGERPSGSDFTDLIDSCLNKASDGLSVDADGNLVLARGIRLGNSAATVAGGLRFNSGQVQFHSGTNWVSLSTGGGAFQPAGGSATAVFHNGFVGIGDFSTTAPTYRFEVNLSPNTSVAEQVRFGSVVLSNGSAAFGSHAQIAHQSRASNTDFAMRQASGGAVHINAPTGQVISIRQGGSTVRFGISTNGNTIVGAESELTGAPSTALLQVGGDAFKNAGSASWLIPSDARLKEDVRELDAGLAELRQLRPIRFRYNGLCGTEAGRAGVGVVAQEIESILPETIKRVPCPFEGDATGEDLRIFDASPLTFVLINAVKELAAKVEQLEQALAEMSGDTAPTRPAAKRTKQK